MQGSEVSNRMPLGLLEVSARRGVAAAPLLAGLSFTHEQLRDRRGRCDWDDFTIFMDRLEEALGGPTGTEDLVFDMIEAHPAMRLIGSLFPSPRALFFAGSERVARRLYQLDFGQRVEALPDGRIRIENSLPPDRRPSAPFWHATVGTYRAYPTLIGLPPADVEAAMSPRRAVFLITLPPSQTSLAWAEPLSRLFPSRSGRGGRGPTLTDMQDAIDMAFDGPTLMQHACPAGQRLARHTDLRALGEELQAILRDNLCSERLGLWAYGAGGNERGVELGGSAAALCSRALTVGGEEVGRIALEDACAESVFVEAILPWVALGVQSCRRANGQSGRGAGTRAASPFERLDQIADAWRLTPRQAQVLELVAQGAANKEIAVALGCSLKTVEAHVGQLLHKAGADGRAALIVRFWTTTGNGAL